MWISSVFSIALFLAAANAELSSDYIKYNNYIYRNGSELYAVTFTKNRSDAVGLFYGDDVDNFWGYVIVIDTANTQDWVVPDTYQDPDLNVIEFESQPAVRLYFAAVEKSSGKIAISVVYNPTLFTPNLYTTVPYQLISADTVDYWSPSLLIYDSGKLVLTYVFDSREDIHDIGAQHLEDSGIDISIFPKTTQNKAIVSPNQWWEGKKLKNQWGFQRGDFIYIVYETEIEGFIGVARGKGLEDVFEKIPTPLYSKNKAFMKREHLEKNFAWGNDGWPYIRN